MSTGPNPRLPNSFAGWAIWLVVIISIVAVLYVMQGVVGIVIPAWVMTLFWICLVAFLVVAAIKFLSRLG